MIQTVHHHNYNGEALAYRSAVTVRNVVFGVNQKARELIASGQENKFPMASVNGEFHKAPPRLEGVEISFNPVRSHLFTDKDGRAVKGADEVTVYGNRVYARGRIRYYTAAEAPKPEGSSPSDVVFSPRH